MTDRRADIVEFKSEYITPHIGKDKIQFHKLLSGGKCNSNYLVYLTGDRKVILRIKSRKELSSVERIFKLLPSDINVNKILYNSDKYCITDYIPGNMMVISEQFLFLAAQTLARIHSVKFTSTGRIDTNGNVIPWNFDNGDFLTSILSNGTVRTYLGKDRIDILLHMHKFKKPIENICEYCLVHGDYNRSNILFYNNLLSGVVDWEFAHAGSPYMDIGNLIREIPENLYSCVYRGLCAGGMNVPHDWIKRAEFTDLGSHLEFLTTNRSEMFKQTRIDWIDKFIQTYSV